MRYAVPESDVQVWLLPRRADTPAFDALLKLWLSELLGYEPLIARSDAGKPYIANNTLQFNISHSPNWFALSWRIGHAPVGVDVEDLERRPRFDALAVRYFHSSETAKWLSADATESNASWLETWTRKEAVLKAHGLGLRLQLNTLDTCHDAVQHPVIGRWQLHSFRLPDAVVSVSWPITSALRDIP